MVARDVRHLTINEHLTLGHWPINVERSKDGALHVVKQWHSLLGDSFSRLPMGTKVSHKTAVPPWFQFTQDDKRMAEVTWTLPSFSLHKVQARHDLVDIAVPFCPGFAYESPHDVLEFSIDGFTVLVPAIVLLDLFLAPLGERVNEALRLGAPFHWIESISEGSYRIAKGKTMGDARSNEALFRLAMWSMASNDATTFLQTFVNGIWLEGGFRATAAPLDMKEVKLSGYMLSGKFFVRQMTAGYWFVLPLKENCRLYSSDEKVLCLERDRDG